MASGLAGKFGHWRVPGVVGECEFRVVRWDDELRLDDVGDLRRLVRMRVDAWPADVVLAVFEESEVEWAERVCDIMEMLAKSAIARDEDAAMRRLENEASP